MRVFKNISLWILLLVVLAFTLVPVLTNSLTQREDLFLILMFVVLASSVNIVMGYTGYVSFGHIVFFGLGGYFSFYLMQNFGIHFALAALAGGIGSSLVAFLIGVPVLRLRGAYFALATIGINEAVRTFMQNFEPFGGALGMFFNATVKEAYGGAKVADQLAYYAMVAIALLTIGASFVIKKSKFGLGLLAIREDQDAASVLGINPARLKVAAYAASAFFPALAGAVFFFKNGIIEPGIAFDLLRSIESMVMVMLGGYGTVAGPIVGAVVYDRLRSFLITNETFSNFHLFIAGALLLVIVLFVTAGVVGYLRQRVAVVRRYVE
jgi:branched-chain amino acid transport system permease protein